jgi:hypothetical protein
MARTDRERALLRQSDPLVDHPAEPAIHRSTAAAALVLVHTHPDLEYGGLNYMIYVIT